MKRLILLALVSTNAIAIQPVYEFNPQPYQQPHTSFSEAVRMFSPNRTIIDLEADYRHSQQMRVLEQQNNHLQELEMRARRIEQHLRWNGGRY